MPLIQANMVKQVLGNTDLELEAQTGEGFLIKNIMVMNPASAHVQGYIDNTIRLDARVSGVLGNHIPLLGGEANHSHSLLTGATALGDQTSFATLVNLDGADIGAKNLGGGATSTEYKGAVQKNAAAIPGYMGLYGKLFDLGIWEGFPIPAGSKFTLIGAKQSGALQIVIYDRYDEGDISHEMQNGKYAKDHVFINYGNTGATISTATASEYDTQVNPVQMVQFPYGDPVPSKSEITLYGILGSDFAPTENDGTDGIGTQYLRLSRGEEVLFDEDRNGLLMYAKDYGDALVGDAIGKGYSLIGNYSDVDVREPFWMKPPILFEEGEELTLELVTVGEGTPKNILIAEQEIGLIMKVTRL